MHLLRLTFLQNNAHVTWNILQIKIRLSIRTEIAALADIPKERLRLCKRIQWSTADEGRKSIGLIKVRRNTKQDDKLFCRSEEGERKKNHEHVQVKIKQRKYFTMARERTPFAMPEKND